MWSFSGHLTSVNHIYSVRCVQCMVFDASGILIRRIIARQSGHQHLFAHAILFSHQSVILNGFLWLHLCAECKLNVIWNEMGKQETNVFAHCIQMIYSLSQPQRGPNPCWTVPQQAVLLCCHFFYLPFCCGRLFIYFTWGYRAYLIWNETPFTLPYILYSIRMFSSCNLTSLLSHSRISVWLKAERERINSKQKDVY